MKDIGELALVTVAALSPMWVLASHRGADEAIKSGIGIACVGAVVAIYRAWLGARNKKARK